MAAFKSVDELLDLIDRGQLTVSSHSVASRILLSLGLNDPLYRAVLDIHEAKGRPAEIENVNRQLWSKIDSSEPGSDGWLRLAVVLTRLDQLVDRELAEYFDYWAQQQGLSERQILAAFGSDS